MGKPIEYNCKVIHKRDSIWRVPQCLISLKTPTDKCLKCKSDLSPNDTMVPISNLESMLINGGYCRRCDILYIEHDEECLKKILNNEYAKGFTLNGLMVDEYSKELFRKQQEIERIKQQEKLRKERIKARAQKREQREKKRAEYVESISGIENAVLMIVIRFEDGEQQQYIIVRKEESEDVYRNIVTYSSELGRELLSAAFAEERKKKGIIEDKRYRVLDVIEKELHAKNSFISDDYYIRRGGGYYKQQFQTSRYETIDYLMFSLKTNRYEMIHATYDKKEKSCFFDISLYRKFVQQYGKQSDYVDFYKGMEESSGRYIDWNTESFLHQYGYNVSQNDDLPESYRHDLLAEIVDLEYMSVEKIVKYLEFFIRTKSSDSRNYFAISKWENDLDFIRNYRVNTSRFLIGTKPL